MISETLKANTKILHDQVEAKFNSNRIFDGTFSMRDYRNLILYNYLFLHNFENEVFSGISESVAEDLNLGKRRKLSLIERDLESLNMEKSTVQILPDIKNEAEALGMLYVMEGSTLGGNVIAKQLSKNPDFHEVSFSYLRCYGDRTGSYWKNFKEVMDTQIGAEFHEDCVAGAQKAYQFLLNVSL
ncbi:heme oxygenase [Flavobacteriaceae bacterium JJC]|nr:heme oxygenase [Flavobacteriaceae bacterium JJC]